VNASVVVRISTEIWQIADSAHVQWSLHQKEIFHKSRLVSKVWDPEVLATSATLQMNRVID